MPYQPDDILFNKYHIERLLGQGAFGEVWLATHTGLNAPRALKLLRKDAPGLGSQAYAEYQARFHLEARLGARLNDPHLVRVHDFEQDGETLALVMEYAPGGSLQSLIAQAHQEKKPIPIEKVIQIACDIAIGLTAIHDLDAVHRDLKPSNLLLDAQGHIKVADLGLAQVSGGTSRRSTLGSQATCHPGTPGYMSPEQEQTRLFLTPASDIYSLGLVLFEMLTGRLYKILRPGTAVHSIRADTPSWISELVQLCLLPNPEARPYNGSEFLRALQTLQGKSQRAHTQASEIQPHIVIYDLLIKGAFSMDDLQDLCFRLDVDWDALHGENTTGAKIRALVKFFQKNGELDKLYDAIVRLRPQFGGQVSILFLTADPTDASQLRLGEEWREIQEKLQLAKQRESFELHQRMSVRPLDISQALLDTKPRIVHFSGHGMSSGELCFENSIGEAHPISAEALAALFEQFTNQIHCVVLNACYSEIQANAIAKHIPYVIGMKEAIGDKAAIAFSVGFYQALGAGCTIEEAYRMGCVQIRLQNIPEYLTPVLLARN